MVTSSYQASLWETNTALCKALGIDPGQVTAVNIKIRGDDFPIVTVRRYTGPLSLEQITSRYRLVPADPAPPATPAA